MTKNAAAQRGGKNSGEKRRLKQFHRILRVQHLRQVEKMSKADIARQLGVSYETILRDCKIFEDKQHSQDSFQMEIIKSILQVARREVYGEITSAEAKAEIGGIIELIAKESEIGEKSEKKLSV